MVVVESSVVAGSEVGGKFLSSGLHRAIARREKPEAKHHPTSATTEGFASPLKLEIIQDRKLIL